MKKVAVVFPKSEKLYTYETNLNLIVGGIYRITNEQGYVYGNPVKVVKYLDNCKGNFRKIIKADAIKVPINDNVNMLKIVKVVFNEEKRTTVVLWSDNTKTIVKCSEEDIFDKEKGLMACCMKRLFGNRGNYNNLLKEFCYE